MAVTVHAHHLAARIDAVLGLPIGTVSTDGSFRVSLTLAQAEALLDRVRPGATSPKDLTRDVSPGHPASVHPTPPARFERCTLCGERLVGRQRLRERCPLCVEELAGAGELGRS